MAKKLVRVEVRKGFNAREIDQNVNDALRTFKRRINRDGVLQELRKREFYVKPGVARRLKHEAAVKALKKKQQKRGY